MTNQMIVKSLSFQYFDVCYERFKYNFDALFFCIFAEIMRHEDSSRN